MKAIARTPLQLMTHGSPCGTMEQLPVVPSAGIPRVHGISAPIERRRPRMRETLGSEAPQTGPPTEASLIEAVELSVEAVACAAHQRKPSGTVGRAKGARGRVGAVAAVAVDWPVGERAGLRAAALRRAGEQTQLALARSRAGQNVALTSTTKLAPSTNFGEGRTLLHAMEQELPLATLEQVPILPLLGAVPSVHAFAAQTFNVRRSAQKR